MKSIESTIMKRLSLILGVLLLFGANAHAQAVLKTSVVGPGGGTSASSSHMLQGTVGSNARGTLAGEGHVVRGGFWPQVYPPAEPVSLPVAASDEVATDEDVPLLIRPLENDSDPDGGDLTIAAFTQPANGAVEETAEGELTYTPAANFNGQDSFSYTAANEAGGSSAAEVVVTVAPVNDPPAFASEPVTGAAASETYIYEVQAADVDGDDLTLTAPTLPDWLTFSDDGDGAGTLEGTPTNAEAGEHAVVLDAGDGSDTAEQSFTVTVVLGAPAAPTLAAPEDASTDVETDVTLEWSNVAGAAFYVVQLATDEAFASLALDSSGVNTATLELADLAYETTYFWRVRAVNGAGASDYSGPFSFTTLSTVAAEAVELPERFDLHQNYPNPFNPTTTIPFAVPEAGRVSIRLFDATGRLVAVLADEHMASGRFELVFNAEGLASGAYVYQMQSGNFLKAKVMLLER